MKNFFKFKRNCRKCQREFETYFSKDKYCPDCRERIDRKIRK